MPLCSCGSGSKIMAPSARPCDLAANGLYFQIKSKKVTEINCFSVTFYLVFDLYWTLVGNLQIHLFGEITMDDIN